MPRSRRPDYLPFEIRDDRLPEIARFFSLAGPDITVVDDIIAALDKEQFARFRDTFVARLDHFSLHGQEKYADFQYWTSQKVHMACRMGLQKQRPQAILDIGTGGGYFLAVLQRLGHVAVGIDRADALYGAIAGLLGVDRRVEPVRALTNVPSLGLKFDLITIHWPGFDISGKSRTPCGEPEWRFLLDDLARNHLRPLGTIHIQLNRRMLGNDRGYPPDVLRFARSFGSIGDHETGELAFRRVRPERFTRTTLHHRIRGAFKN